MSRFKVGDRIRDKEHKYLSIKILRVENDHYVGTKGEVLGLSFEDDYELVSPTYNPTVKKLSSEGDAYKCEISGLSESQYHVLQDLIDSWSVKN